MSWGNATLFSLDTETTGTSVFEDRIITAALVKVSAGEVVDQHDWAIAPDIEVSEGAFNAHGISTEQARAQGGPPAPILSDIARDVAAVLRSGNPLVVFNAAFDLSLIEVECQRHGVPTIASRLTHPDQWNCVVDPMVIAKGLTKDLADSGDRTQWANLKAGKLRLPALCERFGVAFAESHDARADATGSALLAVAILTEYNAIGALGPVELHARQLAWRLRDQRSFREWAEKQGKQDEYDLDDGWPLHTRLTEGANA